MWFHLFFRDGNLPLENKPLPKEPDERKKTKTLKSKTLHDSSRIMAEICCLLKAAHCLIHKHTIKPCYVELSGTEKKV
jgi:hypothetical protein